VLDSIRKYLFSSLKFQVFILSVCNNQKIADLSPEEFCNLISELSPKHIVVGKGFKFGKKQSGDEEYLQTYFSDHNTKIHSVSPFAIDGIPVGSSLIRKLITKGNLKKAAKMLGYNFTLEGEVVHGLKIGRKLGFPTANLNTTQILPPAGR